MAWTSPRTWVDGEIVDAALLNEHIRDNFAEVSPGTLAASFARKAGVNIADYATLKAAIAALPSTGGTVVIPTGRWLAGDWTYDTDYMSKPDVRLVGEKMPHLSANADRLEGGAVIEGRFNAFAHGFHATDVGFDMGKHVIDTRYSSAATTTANHPLGGTWDAFAFAQPNSGTPLASRRGVHLDNVIGLLKQPTTLGHAMLIEGIDGGTVGNATGVGGVHGVIIKSRNMRIGNLAGWSASSNCVIVKADTYAPTGHLSIGNIEAFQTPPNTTPHWATVEPANGLLINPATDSFAGPIQIGRVKAFACDFGLKIDGGAGKIVDGLQIEEFITDGFGASMTSGIELTPTCRALNVQIGRVIIANTVQGIAWNVVTAGDAGNPLRIGNAQLTICTSRAFNLGGYGRVVVDHLTITSSQAAYFITSNARMIVGKELLQSVVTKWETSPPALAANWSNSGSGNSTFEVMLENYGVAIKGLLVASASAGGVFATLPAYLRPTEAKRFPGYHNNGGTRKFLMVGVSTTGNVDINDATAPATGDFISVDGIGWQHY